MLPHITWLSLAFVTHHWITDRTISASIFEAVNEIVAFRPASLCIDT